PEDPRLIELADLLARTFPDSNSVLGLDRIRQFLADGSQPAPQAASLAAHDNARRFRVLVAQDGASARVLGLSIFSYVPRANCGFSEYLVVEQSQRGHGLGRKLFDARRALLDADARAHDQSACDGLFIEVDSPWRTPPALLAAESVDAMERLRIFDHL